MFVFLGLSSLSPLVLTFKLLAPVVQYIMRLDLWIVLLR